MVRSKTIRSLQHLLLVLAAVLIAIQPAAARQSAGAQQPAGDQQLPPLAPRCPDPSTPCPPPREDGATPTPPGTFTLTVTFTIVDTGVPYSIVGAGAVTSSPLGINCESICTATFREGTVQLFARPSPGWAFGSWGGDCRGTEPATSLTVRRGQTFRAFVTCSATFRPADRRAFTPDILGTTQANRAPAFDTTSVFWTRDDVCLGDTFPASALGSGSPFEWMPVIRAPGARNFDELTTYPTAASGTALLPQLSGKDVPFTHPFGFDWEFFIALDAHYQLTLPAASNGGFFPSSNAGPDQEYQDAVREAFRFGLATPRGVLGLETDRGLIPELYRVQNGDRVAVFGRWIGDCGHDDFHTEIHPPLLLAAARAGAGGEATRTTLIANPYLVSQYFGDGALLDHLIREVGKVQGIPGICGDIAGFIPWPPGVPCSTKVEAHAPIHRIPFVGLQQFDYFVKPAAPRRDPGDRLSARLHFTARRGVTVQLYNAGPDTVGVRVTLNDQLYQPPPLPRNRGCNLGLEDIRTSDPTVGDILYGLVFGDIVFDPVAAPILATGVAYDCFDPPLAQSRTDGDIRTVLVADLAQLPTPMPGTGVALPVYSSEDDGQPFPVYGWLDLEWERRDTAPPVVTPPASIIIPATEAGGATWNASPALGSFLFGSSAVDNSAQAPTTLWPLFLGAPAPIGATIGGFDVRPDTLFPLGTTVVAFRARDAAGNVGSATATVTVVLGTPRLALVVDNQTVFSPEAVLLELRLVNRGDGHARNVRLTAVDVRTRTGAGAGTLEPTGSPPLPFAIGPIDVGGSSHQFRVALNVPSTSSEFEVVERGTLEDVAGREATFATMATIQR